ncbi:lipopolysaccharide biosynthesis protein [Thermaurantiacus sp.]
MLRRLGWLSGVNGLAFALVGVLGLAIVPPLVDRFGLAGYGLLIWVRLFLPAGALALFDWGIADMATIAVARSEDRNAPPAGPLLALLFGLALLTGLLTGGGIGLASAFLARASGAEAQSVAAVRQILLVTALALPLIFAGLVLEGILKGREQFLLLRASDLAVAGCFAAAVFGLPSLTLADLGILYVGLLGTRVGVLAAAALPGLPSLGLRWPTSAALSEVRERASLMAFNRVLGVAQGQLPPMLIAPLLGASAVGLFDVLTRLPRFLKSVFGLLNSAVLPLAVRLEADPDPRALQRFGMIGTLVVAMFVIPVTAVLAGLAEPVLERWVGPRVTTSWGWMAAMLLVPMLTALSGFGASALIARAEMLRSLNRLALLQVICQYAIAIALLHSLRELSFIAGLVVSVVVVFPLQYRLISTGLGLPDGLAKRLVLLLSAGVGVALVLAVVTDASSSIATLLALGASSVGAFAGICILVLDADDRGRLVRSLLRSSRPKTEVGCP